MHTYVEGQWSQVFSREEWQQQSGEYDTLHRSHCLTQDTVDMLTSYRELEIFQPAHKLTHQRPTKKRKRTRTKPDRQDKNDILLPKSLHQRRELPTGTFYNARR
ncbi:hypothetical protein H9Q70_011816 [Fusarium xylarioides]|nr:hypothetical protein H9Q70_011816 [Fusarium xylarioides]KAG5777185.1 hypothetical protein H9Q73_009160 [Fusarium xylarioides]